MGIPGRRPPEAAPAGGGTRRGGGGPGFFTSVPSLAHLNPLDRAVASSKVRVQVWREPKGKARRAE
jgi:hypothetical protein